jgi:gliding motility-associated lipoprotein GldH
MISCGPTVIYDQTETIEKPWDYFSPITFEYNISDTLMPYDLQLIVDHTSSFTYENLYINATTIFPDGNKTSHPVSLQLANASGDWLGDCSGDKCETAIEISSSAYFKKVGKYKLIIEQFSRNSGLEGINKFTLKIIEHQNTK